MAKQLNIDVNLNTAKASAQLKALQQMLQEAINSSTSKGTLTREIVSATEAATKLKSILNSSMNSKGNLDLSKFSANLKASGTNLTQYAQQLNNLGTQGQQAFLGMAKQITAAQAPIKQTNTLANTLFTSLKNTARWQLSSAMLHGVINTFHNAFSYARGLNESLNSIRIVTGLSADEMNRFAESANKSAKALSASTLDYTDAALIYYQQGIRDQKQIKERTDATIKMANVTGDSAAKVSNQLTAIWNNFDKGGQNLEYYADVITALGAATASSSSEISAGLEKFASIAEETGLSYEYATSSLATIVATTRQSADVVGTALKTIFGRVQSLNLGETLEDGTTLGKYSKALEKVGINIKDQNGQLKDMDIILDEMGGKWETLNRDQKVAMAQAVAGARQYNQLMALMENYDFFKENVNVARGSKGTLEKQQEIYAESWQAAKDRVKASWQGILDDVISDDFFIGLNNGFAGLLTGVNKFIDTIGGIPGTLALVSAGFMKIFQKPLQTGFNNLAISVNKMRGVYVDEHTRMQQETSKAIAAITPTKDSPQSLVMQAKNMQTELNFASLLSAKQQDLARHNLSMSAAERLRISTLQELSSLYGEQSLKAQEVVEAEENALLATQRRMAAQAESAAIRTTLSNGGTQGAAIVAGMNAYDQRLSAAQQGVDSYRSLLRGQNAITTLQNGYAPTEEMLRGLSAAVAMRFPQGSEVRTGLSLKQFTQQGYSLQSNKSGDWKTLNAGALPIAYNAMLARGGLREGLRIVDTKGNVVDSSQIFSQSTAGLPSARNKVLGKYFSEGGGMYSDIAKIQEAQKAGLLGPNAKTSRSAIDDQLLKESQTAQSRLTKRLGSLGLDNLIRQSGSSLMAQLGDEKFVNELRESARRQVEAEYNKNIGTQEKSKIDTKLSKSIEQIKGAKLNDNLSSAAMSVANIGIGVSSLVAGFKALNDESLSFGQKLLQTSTSFGMGIGMLTMGLKNIGPALAAVSSGITGLMGALTVKGGLTALFAAGGPFATFIPTLMSVLPAIAAITAVIGAVMAMKAAQKAAFEASPEGQLKTAQQHATDMKTALAETKSAAEELQSSFNNYDSVSSNLNTCIKGTQEWTEALRENNNEVINMLAKYPQLAAITGAVQKNADGSLSISKAAKEAVLEQSAQNVRAAEWASAQAAQDVIKKQQLVNQQDIGNKFKNISDVQEVFKEYSSQTPVFNILSKQDSHIAQERQSATMTIPQSQDIFGLDAIGEDIKNTWNKGGIKQSLTSISNSLDQQSALEMQQRIKAMPQNISNAIDNASNAVENALNSVANNMQDLDTESAEEIKQNGKNLLNTISDSFKNAQEYHSTFSDNVKSAAIDLKNEQRIKNIQDEKNRKIQEEAEAKLQRELETGTHEARKAARARKERLVQEGKELIDSFNDTKGVYDDLRKESLDMVSNVNAVGQPLKEVLQQIPEQVVDTYTENYQERRMGNIGDGQALLNNIQEAYKTTPGAYDNARKDQLATVSNEGYSRVEDLLDVSMDYTSKYGSYHERNLGGNKDFAGTVKNGKEEALKIISQNWSNLMAMSVEEMGPALDKVFQDSGISLHDSSAWAKELTTNADLRKALNENAYSVMAAATAQAAQEASTINEQLVSEGYSKGEAERISKLLGQQGELSELTKTETNRIDRELRKKDTNAQSLAKQYIASMGGMESSLTWSKTGISYKDASGADKTATWDMMSSALGAAAALEQLGTSAQAAAQFLATLHSDDISDDTSKGVEEYLENGDFLNMKPEELVEQAGKSAEDISKELKKVFDEDTFKEATGKTIDEFAEAMENTAKGNLEAWNQMFDGMTGVQKEQMLGLNKYQEMSAGELISYYNRHFKDQELIKLPDLSEDIKTYAQLEEEVGTIDEAWGKVGNSIQNGTHLTQDMYDLFEALDVNAGDWGQFVDGDLITDAEGLIECLNEATNSTRDLIEHARQMDMITYDNLTEDLINLVANTDDATRATDAFGDSLEHILSQMDGLELSMAKYQQLQETLNGSTSLFDQFDKAKTADAAADWSDEWVSAIQDMNELVSKGDYNGQAWKTGQQLLLPERLQGASAQETQDYIDSLSKRGFVTNEGKEKYDVTWDNAVNFANAALNTKLDNGNTVFSGSLSEGLKLDSSIKSLNDLAAAMDLSETSASALFSRLSLVAHDGDSLWTQLAENAGDFGTQILTAEEQVATLGEKLNAARKAGNWDEYNAIKQQIQEAGAEVDKLKQKAAQKVDFQLNLKDEISQAETEIDKAQKKVDDLKQKVQENPGDTGLSNALTEAEHELEAAKKRWQSLVDQIEDVSEFEIKIHLEKAYSQLQQLKATIQEVQNDTFKNGQRQRNEEVASKNIVDQYGHKIVTKKGLQDYSQAVEQKINVTVEATGADEVYANIKARYEATKGDVEGNPAKIKANNTIALLKIAAAKAAATAFASGTYNASLTATDNTGGAIASATAKVLAFKALKDSVGLFQGSAQFTGSAYERGSWGIKSNERNALVGELGQELIVDPQTGRYYTVGDAGAEFIDIPKGAIIFNHRQTEGLLKNRRINTRGQAYLQGSAFAGLPTIEAPPGKTLPSAPSTSGSTGSNNTGNSGGNNKGTGKGKGGAATAADGEILTYEEQLLTIIREEVDEYANLERSITRLEHAYKNFTRNNDRLWGKALLENIQNSINQGKKLYEAEYAKLKKRQDDYVKSAVRLNSTNELQYQQKVLVGGAYNKDAKYNTQLITFQDFKGMDFLTGLGFLSEDALQRGSNGEVSGVNDVVAVDKAIAEYLRQQGIEANTLRTTHPGEEGEVLAENLMNNANAIAELLDKLLKEYIDSEAEMLEQEEKAQDTLEAIHDLAAEKIIKELEMRIQLQDNERKLIDFAVKRIGDNPFRQAEKFRKQFDPNLPLRENGIIGTLIKKMDASVDAWNKANDQLALGQKDPHDENAISLERWQDITQKSFDEIMNDLNDLVDFINDMAEAFSKTAELGMAEIEKYTGRMEHTVSVLDHIGKLLDLTGRKYDFGARKTIIEGAIHNLENAWKEAEHWANLMTQQREESEKTYQELLTTDAEGAEWYKQNVLDKSYELEQDALEKMYDAAENYMTKVEELWEVGLEEIMANWEEAATKGQGFDFLSNSMSRAKSIQEEYLTTTNKLYETNTLMRKVQQNIDKTDSKISKEKLASFNKEIEAAQQKNQLSVVEMEILKARYELLEAQLALEEARDAKSIVRLQRDNEGNYGYVYTADQDDIDEKEQEVADKENDLYNLVLGYYNDNQEKRLQIQREYQDAAKQLWIDYHDKHLMDTDEYNRKMAELQSQCNAKLLAIDSNLVNSEYWLNVTGAEGVSEAWTNSYDNRIASTEEYMTAFTKASEDSEALITRIDEIRDAATQNAQLGLQDVAKKTEELTKKNDELAKQAEITANKVADEMRSVDKLTASLAAQYTQIQNLITAYYQYAQAMQAAMQAQGPEDAKPGGDEDLSHSYFVARGSGDMETANIKADQRVIKYTTTGMERYNSEKDGGYLTENEGMIAVGDVAIDQLGLTGEQASDVYHAVTLAAARRGENFSDFSPLQQRAEVTHTAHELGYTEKDAHFTRHDGYKFASGGYTGEWGPEGKLAVLHEKELVLNKDDTSNFLKALEIAKANYEQMVSLQDLQQQYRAALFDSVSNSMTTMFNKSSDTLQQEVTIHAEFPNATSHSEIEQAFDNLVNRAAQYASQAGWARDYDNTFR